MRLVAMTYQGLEQVLADELSALGAEYVEVKRRAVYFQGDETLLYAANIHLYTAIRILMPIFYFRASGPDDMYDKAKALNWEEYLSIGKTFAIQHTIHSDLFPHSQYAAQKLKDAIVDRFRENSGERPSVNVPEPDIPVFLHISHDKVSISLNASGDSLHKRGYRGAQHQAPLSEVLAAGLLKLSGWSGREPFYDPMCGSATLPIEAGLQAFRIAPGLIRNDYAFKNWVGFQPDLFRAVLMDAQAATDLEKRVIITASDEKEEYIKMGLASIRKAKLDGKVSLFTKRFEDADPPKHPGVAIINPPYGQRMEKQDIIAFYKKIGDVLKRKYGGWRVWIFTANLDAAKFIGLKPSRKIILYNGPLEGRFLEFELYSGSRKGKNAGDGRKS